MATIGGVVATIVLAIVGIAGSGYVRDQTRIESELKAVADECGLAIQQSRIHTMFRQSYETLRADLHWLARDLRGHKRPFIVERGDGPRHPYPGESPALITA